MQPFLIALQFLTRIPVKFTVNWSDQNNARSLLYYPLVGLILGLLLVLPASFINQAEMLTAAITLTLWVILTGGLHLDGLADSADAWAGGHGKDREESKQKTLSIMKDPRSGPLGITVIVLILLLKFSALHTLISTQQTIYIIAAPILGRGAILLLFLTTPYVRQNGLGSAIANHLGRKPVILSLTISTVASAIFIPFFYLIFITLILLLIFYLIRHLMMQRIQGMTGDTIGATVEVIETSVLISSCFFI